MEAHKRLVSILHIIYGTLTVLFFLIISAIIRTIFPFIMDLGPIPSIVGGIATLYNKSWGFPTLMVSGCLGLLNIPIGTALGIYTIWVFLEDQKIKKAE